MAKQIESLLVRLGIEGYEELARLKGAFRGLETTLGQSDAALDKARQAILDYGKDAQRSERLLKGMEAALKGVREQATLHSPLYTQLTQDITELSAAQREYIADLNSTKSAYAQLALAEEGAARRAAKLRNIQQLAVEENPLVVAGRRPTEFGGVPQVAPGPGGVFIAPPGRSTPYRPGTQYDRPIGPEPLSQEIKDANERRKQEIRDRIENLKAINAENAALREKAAINRSIERGRERLTAAQGTSEYRTALRELAEVNRRSDQTIKSLNEQRNAWNALRNVVDPASATFAEASQKVKELDESLEKLSITQKKTAPKRGFSARQAAEVAGAAISGGIFGGPEGFLGGVAGGALGGVGGAFAGAALGAQVAGLRQAAGAAAEYAAAINQQRRALEGVVDSNAAYQQSLAFIDQTSRQLAIPQEQVTRNFTRLSASVLGAGGNVDAAQEAFLGIAAGIRGTGGSLADLDAALLATAQVFSKGKVSAEELRGQIGERLPGAFTLFAESIGKTPQELDKLLEKGEVTLNDFLTFTRRLTAEYGAGANELANSSEAAGDRLVTALGRIQEAIGKAFQPVGAEFQEALSRFVLENEQALVSLAQSLADVGKGFLDFVVTAGPALVELGKFALAFGAATLATKAFTAAVPLVSAALRLMGAQFIATNQQVTLAEKRLVTFGGTVKALAASLAAPIVLTVAIVGAGVVIDWLNKIKGARDRLREAQSDIRGDAWVQSIGGQSQSLQQLQQQVQAAGNTYQYLADKIKAARQEMASTPFKPRKEFLAQQIAADEAQLAVAQSRYQAGVAALGRKQASVQPSTGFQFPSPAADAAGAKEKKGPKPPEDRTQELRAEAELFNVIAGYENQIRDLLFEGKEIKAADAEYNKQVAQIEAEREKAIRAANYESEKQAIRTLATLKLRDAELRLEDSIREIRNKNFQQELQNQEAVRNAVEPLKQAREQQELQLQNAKEYGRLVAEGVLPDEAQRIINWQNLVAQQLKSLDTQIKITEEQITQAELKNQELGKEDIATKQLRDRLALLRRQREAVQTQAQAGPGRGPTQAERVQFEIDKLQGELNQLASISNVIVNSANAIGDAFANAFQKLISGTASAKEVLAGFFQDTANAFIKMATEIIAKQIVMLILQTALKALGAAGGSSGPTSFGADNPVGDFAFGSAPIPADTAFPVFSAKGNAFTPQGPVQMYAKGGVVNGITPFRFAKGGTMGLGVMGEAGPEAVLPLKRNASGELGVLQVPYTKAGVAQGGSENDMIRFESVVINNQEYVTREEAERIGRVAASRGADIAQRRIKNNPQVRRSLGMA